MARAIRTEIADQDLDEIAYYIAIHEGRPSTADRAIDEIIAKCDRYAASPLIGVATPELGDNYRIFRHKRWVISLPSYRRWYRSAPYR